MLTLLTMLLVVIICLRRQTSMLFMALAAILVNIIGFALGWGTAALLKLLNLPLLAIYPISTFICTQIIGWGTDVLAREFVTRHPEAGNSLDSKSLRWLLIAFVLVLLLRFIIIMSRPDVQNSRNFALEIGLDYVFSSLALVWVAEFAIRSRQEANLAHYRYIKLKQQVNPHFLFNSLNILDCMIQEQSTQAASEYTHKLAEIYRYMIKSEDEITVNLRDEMEFVSKFVDLLKVRFGDGFKVNINIPEADLSRSVIPCCVQLLIENATKHNSFSSLKPLVVGIHTTSHSVVVSNNLCPKITSVNSTGLGLKYIRQQYKDIAQRSVVVKETTDTFTVILPLL